MSIVFVEKGEIDVIDGAFVVVDQQGLRVRPVLTQIPVGGIACIMLERGDEPPDPARPRLFADRVPHVRGDEPAWVDAYAEVKSCSPRAWG